MNMKMLRFLRHTGIAACALLVISCGYQRGPMPDDEAVSRAIEQELALSEAIQAHLIDVETEEGIVMLEGSVPTLQEKRHARRLAEIMAGVRGVINRLRVKPVAIGDEMLRERIRTVLGRNPVMEQADVQISVNNGVVALNGEVASAAEKNFAGHLLRGIKGVRAVRNELTIDRAVTRSDEEAAADIRAVLRMDPFVNERHLRVEVRGGKVNISGEVGSLSEKTYVYNDARVAGIDAVDVTGVKISYGIRDRDKRRSKLLLKNPEKIEAAVREILRLDPRVDAGDIGVKSEDQIVTLFGFVSSRGVRRAAERDARNVAGVWAVRNMLSVKPQEAVTDQELARTVNAELSWDPLLERFPLRARVEDQRVYLRGTVENLFQKFHAEEVAGAVPGVVDVRNHVSYPRRWGWRSDEELGAAIRAQLFWDARVKEDTVEVEVNDSTAVLTGTLSSVQEAHAAIVNAFQGGARAVKSKLSVKGMEEHGPVNYTYRDFYQFAYEPPDLFTFPPEQFSSRGSSD
ncbi:MAG: BON domain-containing protein [Candidatus Omnitrophica bacterium]|nr:BON domain-containing protein [Candidatus Omnitrophota bacterium]